jgi:cytochrome P450
MKVSKHNDAFSHARRNVGVAKVDDQDDPATMVLGLKQLRKCAHNWRTFQSGAIPGRIVIPSEVNIRSIRQIPFELDPPEHKDYRTLLEPWFKRPNDADYQQALHSQITSTLKKVSAQSVIEVVSELALVVQSQALTLLLNTPFEAAQTWIDWGTHVFRSEGQDLDADKANVLYKYIDDEIDRAIQSPSEDLYSVLLSSQVNGQALTKEAVKGILILTFAGGRDTVINAISSVIAYLAETPEALLQLKQDESLRTNAIEEFIRYFSPLTHMGRVATEDTEICEHAIKANSRISLCWASANRDEQVFDNPNEIILDRKLNPHVGFGFGVHNCLGATHARQVLLTLVNVLCEQVSKIELINAQEHIEKWNEFERKNGFKSLHVKFNGL